MLPESFACYLVRQVGKDRIEASVERRPLRELPPGDVLVRVERSSINYKDAMAARGHPGIVRKFPHVPGIDAAGTVVSSEVPQFRAGDRVLTTGHQLGTEHWGGWAEYIRVPSAWLLPLPHGLNVDEAMAYGTAGFTAAQCILSLLHHGITPEKGEVVVTGATGGVASLAIMMLAKLGYRIAAVTGKADQHQRLLDRGAARVIDRSEFLNVPNRPLLSAQFSGAVETVGGDVLSTVVRMIEHRGCVSCCGVAGGADLSLTVYPFILRGVTLAGIDSALCPDDQRPGIWQKLAGPWKPDRLMDNVRTVSLPDVTGVVNSLLEGTNVGRVVVDLERV